MSAAKIDMRNTRGEHLRAALKESRDVLCLEQNLWTCSDSRSSGCSGHGAMRRPMSGPSAMDKVESIDNPSMRSVKTATDQYLPMDTSGLQQLEHLEKELEQAKQKILVLRAQEHRETSSPENKVSESRYWTNDERQRFKKALKTFGTDFAAIAKFVGTRSSTQVRTHAQKYYAKLIRDYKRSGKASATVKGREEKGGAGRLAV